MSSDTGAKTSRTYKTYRAYWLEEFSLVAVLLLFFAGIVGFSFGVPFDARLFPLVVGTAGLALCLVVAVYELRRHGSAEPVDVVRGDDPAANASWLRFATALLAAPVFGFIFWLFGFFVASLTAMLLLPHLMGYPNRRLTLLVGLATVAVLAVLFPFLVGVRLPHGIVGDWLIDQVRSH